ncbi:unnamed protein product [Caenorhabditis brenneri]
MSECYDLHNQYEPGLEGKRQRPVKRRKGFKLLCLPGLARNEVIRSMDINEMIDKNSSSFQNCVSIFKHLQNIFWFKSHCFFVNLVDMTEKLFKEVLTEPAFKEFEILSLDGGEIDQECLDLVMETTNINSDLHIYETLFPVNYYHENAFKFDYTTYYFAEWVRIEYLFTLKDRYSLRLRYHNLTDSDLNTYIKFWIENDHDMVYLLALHMRPFEPEILFDGIVVLVGQRNGFTYHLVACNPTKQRKKQIMGVRWSKDITHLYSWNKDETLEFEGNVYTGSWEPEYKLLMILNRKKELEEQLKNIQNLLKTNQDQNMVKKENDLSRDLHNISMELDSYNLVFRDGVYSHM